MPPLPHPKTLTMALLFASALQVASADPETTTDRPLDGPKLVQWAFQPKTLRQRRLRLLKSLKKGALFIAAATPAPKEDYDPYRQNPNFLYLSGLRSGPAFILARLDKNGELDDILLLPHRSRYREVWEGKRPTVESETAKKRGYRRIAGTDEVNQLIARLSRDASSLVITRTAQDMVKAGQLKLPNKSVSTAAYALDELRLTKDAGEIALLERAIDITCAAQIEAMTSIRPGQFEYELQATIEYVFMRYGAQHPAFSSICGSGPKSCVLHYHANRRRMKKGDLIVVDVGANFAGYCADVTRTVPISGKFTPRQKEIYNIVLKAQKAGFDAVKPGATLRDVHRAAMNVIRRAGYGRYFPHGTSHWLGLETHDTPYAPRNVRLKPGMVLTVEPGIYIPEEELGVRIEDDVVVTKTGCRILSKAVPRTIPEIEAICQRKAGVGARPVAPLLIRPRPSAKPHKTPRSGQRKLYGLKPGQ